MALSTHLPDSKAVVSALTEFDEANIAVPKFSLPQHSMLARAALMMTRNELRCDGNPDLNLASFVTTEVEPEAMQIMVDNLNKNLADTGEYPQLNDLQDRCVNMLAGLFHAPSKRTGALSSLGEDEKSNAHACGTSTVGSSEAIMLAGLALKWKWRARMAEKQGKKAHEINARPNLIFGAAVHVSILKLCRYFDIEARIVPLERDQLCMDIHKAVRLCDENTCGILAVFGTTLTGELEDIQGLCDELDKLQQTKGLDIPVHVDGASGAMVAPFLYSDLVWDFRLERVKSINISGHKFSQSLPGLGWVVWKSRDDLPEDLIFHVNYLGVDEPTFTLNFSRSGGTVALQYYQFLRLGFDGYQRLVQHQLDNARHIATALTNMCKDLFIIHSKHDEPWLPLVVFSINPERGVKFSASSLVHWLRERNWIVPAYSLPANVSEITVMRIVVRETLTRGMADMLIDDIRVTLIALAHHYGNSQLIDELMEARDPHHVSRRSRQHRQRTRYSISEGHHDHQAEHVARSPSQPHNSHRDADKVREMGHPSGKAPQQTQAKGPPTSHVLC